MFFEIVSPSTAQQMLARLSEPEKIQIRMLQNEAQLDSFRHEFLKADGPPSLDTMKEVHASLMESFKQKTNFVSTQF